MIHIFEKTELGFLPLECLVGTVSPLNEVLGYIQCSDERGKEYLRQDRHEGLTWCRRAQDVNTMRVAILRLEIAADAVRIDEIERKDQADGKSND